VKSNENLEEKNMALRRENDRLRRENASLRLENMRLERDYLAGGSSTNNHEAQVAVAAPAHLSQERSRSPECMGSVERLKEEIRDLKEVCEEWELDDQNREDPEVLRDYIDDLENDREIEIRKNTRLERIIEEKDFHIRQLRRVILGSADCP